MSRETLNHTLVAFEQQITNEALYLTPFEREVKGGNLNPGDPITPNILQQQPHNEAARRAVDTFRATHPVYRGTVFALDVSTNFNLWKRKITPEIQLHGLDDDGHIDGVEVAFYRGDEPIEDLTEVGDIQIHPEKTDRIAAKPTDHGTVFLYPTEAYFTIGQ